MILVIVEDMIFLSKIQQTAAAAGVKVGPAMPDNLVEMLGRGQVSGVIIDLKHASGAALETVRRLKADPSSHPIPVVGFLSHVQAELAAAAREAGCDQVMARSAFAQQLPQLLRKLAG
ncbi:MAG: hypothetical protein ACE145_19925 [Terriglobia bacterium]